MKKRLICTFLVLAFMLALMGSVLAVENNTESISKDIAFSLDTDNQDTLLQGSKTTINPLYPDYKPVNKPSASKPQKAPRKTPQAGTISPSIDDAGASLRAGLVKRSNYIEVTYNVSEEIDGIAAENLDATLFQVSDEILESAFKHTGKGEEGDYLRWQFASAQQGYSGYQSTGVFTFSYGMEYYTTSEQESEENEVLESVERTFGFNDNTTDYEKVLNIYNYICGNVSYDNEHLEDDSYVLKYTSYAALVNKTAVCQGYANLFYRLALDCGVNSRLIVGTGNGGNHAWNIVELNDRFYNLDSTWDSSYYSNGFSYNYFLRGKNTFGNHIAGITSNGEAEYLPEEINSLNENDYDIPLSIQRQPRNTYAEVDETAVFSVMAVGNNLSYKWHYRFSEEDGWQDIGTGNYFAVNVRDSYEGLQVYCTVSDGQSTIDSSIAMLHIGEYSFEICEQPTNVEARIGSVAEFHVAVTGDGVQYRWQYFNSEDEWEDILLDGSYETLSILTDEERNGSQYRCVLTDSYGNELCSDVVKLTVCEYETEGLEYRFEEGKAIVTGYSGNETEIVIPRYKNGIPVMEIGQEAFVNHGLSSIVIPETVSVIEPGAFGGNSFSSFVWPESVHEIPMGCFYGCENLSEIEIPDAVAKIGIGAFTACAFETFDWPATVSVIPEVCFAACRSLRRITIPETVTSIKTGAFAVCGFTSFDWPEAITKIPAACFFGCRQLETLNGISNVETIQMGAFEACGFSEFVWPEAARKIPQSCFAFCVNMTEISNIDDVEEIGNYAFLLCNFTSIIWPKKVTVIPMACFFGSTLESVEIPETVEAIGKFAFGECFSLDEMRLGGNAPVITETENDAFENYYYNEAENPQFTYSVISYCEGIVYIPGMYNPEYDFLEGAFFVSHQLDETVEFCDRYSQPETVNVYYPSNDASWTEEAKSALIAPETYNYRTINWIETETEELAITSQPESVEKTVGEDARFQVEATGSGLSYQWEYSMAGKNSWKASGMEGNKTDTLTVPATMARNGQKYRCVIRDGKGNTVTSEEATLTVKPESTITITRQPEDQAGNNNEAVKFTVEAEGEGLTYQWQYYDTVKEAWKSSTLSGNKTDTLTVRATEERDGMRFRCVITDSNTAKAISEEAKLRLLRGPVITVQPEDQRRAEGATVQFRVEAEGEGLTYQWQYYNAEKKAWRSSSNTGNKTATLKVQINESRDGLRYRCVIRDGEGGKVTSGEATLTRIAGPEITEQPTDRSGTAGSKVKFTVSAEGEGLTYQWQYYNAEKKAWRNSSGTGNKTETLTIEVAEERNGMKYRCVVTNGEGGKSISEEAVLTMVEGPKITEQPEDQSGALGSMASFRVRAEGEGLTYQWQYYNVEKKGWRNSTNAGNKTDTLKVEITEARNGMQYRCVVTGGDGLTSTSRTAVLSVQ